MGGRGESPMPVRPAPRSVLVSRVPSGSDPQDGSPHVDSLVDILRSIFFDDEARADYQANPGGFLAAHGFDSVDAQDVNEAVAVMCGDLPPEQVQVLSGQTPDQTVGG